MSFTIKVSTNEEAFALRNAMHSMALETGKVRPSDVYTMLDLNVPYAPDAEDGAFWTITEIRNIQIQKLEDMGWCLKIPMPSAHEAKKEGVPGCDSLAEKLNISPDELELRVRITDAINGKFSDTTVVTIDYIGKRLQAAYSRGLKYDVSDLREHVMELAKNSPHHRDRCCKAVEQMRFKSDGISPYNRYRIIDLDGFIAHELRNYPDRIKDMVEACAALKSCEFHAAKKALGPDYDFCFDNEDSIEELQHVLKRQLNALPTRTYIEHCQSESPANYESKDNMVSHPPHYQSESGLEVIDVIKAFTEGLTGIVATDAGNIIKYACRWHKKNGIQDLEKILWYTQHLINELKQEDIRHE